MALVVPSAGDTASAATDIQQFKDHLEGAAGSTLAWNLRAAASNNIIVTLADAGGTYKFSVRDSAGVEVAYIDSDGGFSAASFAPALFTLPTGSAPTPTAEGEIWWDTDDDVLRIGTGAATATLDPASAVTAHSDLTGIGTGDHHTQSHAWASASDHTGTAWRMVYTNGSGAVTELGLGTNGYHLRANGSAAAPTWEAVAGTHATNHSDGGSDEVTVENLAATSTDTSAALRPDGAGGLAFSDISLTDATGGNWKTIYTNGTGVVTELALGTSTYVLTSNGASSAPSWQDPSAAVAAHASTHLRGAADEIDGDTLDIDWNPSNYTPATNPTETSSVDHLTSHLYGIDQAFGAVHAQSHTIASHSDTTGTGAELNTLTGGGSTTLHSHASTSYTILNKTADQSLDTSSTTLQSVSGFSFAVSANKEYRYELALLSDAPTAADIKIDWSLPSGASQRAIGNHRDPIGGNATVLWGGFRSGSLEGSSIDGTTEMAYHLTGTITVAGTGGTAQLQAAQNTSDAATVKIIKGTWMLYEELA